MKAWRTSCLLLITTLAIGPWAKGGAAAADPLADASVLAAARPGLRVMRVRGESMEPFFSDGAVLVVKAISAARLSPGMVIVYRNRFGETVAHRVIAAAAGGWRVQGQANDRPDTTLVTPANLIGVVYAVFTAMPAVASAPVPSSVEVALAAPVR